MLKSGFQTMAVRRAGGAAAIEYILVETAKLNGVDPQGWLADTLACIPDHKITRVDDLLPWNCSNHAT
jgi:transposase